MQIIALSDCENFPEIKEFSCSKAHVSKFTAPHRLVNLQTLSIQQATLWNGTIDSIAMLPELTHLDLSGCTVVSGDNFLPLLRSKKLKVVTLTGATLEDRHHNALLGQLHLLRKNLSKAVVVPNVVLPEYAAYEKVLSCQQTKHSVARALPRRIDAAYLLNLKEVQSYYSCDIGQRFENYRYLLAPTIPYDYNTIEGLAYPINASPIRCPDQRRRFATTEPTIVGDYWQAALQLRVSLIVMVKERGNYFPMKEGEQLTFTDSRLQNIHIRCQKVVSVTAGLTLRTLLINSEYVIYHLHQELADGFGMNVKGTLELLNQIELAESEFPNGASFIHCAAGLGRTGLVFGCLIVKQLFQEKIQPPEVRLDLEQLILGLREQRANMLHTDEQLWTIMRLFQCLAVYAKN